MLKILLITLKSYTDKLYILNDNNLYIIPLDNKKLLCTVNAKELVLFINYASVGAAVGSILSSGLLRSFSQCSSNSLMDMGFAK